MAATIMALRPNFKMINQPEKSRTYWHSFMARDNAVFQIGHSKWKGICLKCNYFKFTLITQSQLLNSMNHATNLMKFDCLFEWFQVFTQAISFNYTNCCYKCSSLKIRSWPILHFEDRRMAWRMKRLLKRMEMILHQNDFTLFIHSFKVIVEQKPN